MTIKDAEFLKKLRATFKIEAQEHLRNISLSLFELEKVSNKEDEIAIIETIHREFHSLKGASRAVNMKEIETICHTVETIFSNVKKETLKLNLEMFDVFNKAMDIIEDSLYLDEGEDRDISSIMDDLKKIESNNFQNSNVAKSNKIQIDNNYNMKIEDTKDDDKDIKLTDENIEIAYVRNNTIVKKANDIKIYEDKKSEIVRVSKSKLDSLLLQGEEMIYAKLSVVQRAKEAREIKELLELWKKERNYTFIEMLESSIINLVKSAENDAKTIESMTDSFMSDIKDIMLLPFTSIIEGFPKMVRELSRKIDKEIEFISSGTEIEIDRRILEEIKDPFMHIIRNSIDHGIESREERELLKKNSKGTIVLAITQESSDKIKIEISDDGSGIDIDKVKEKCIKNNIITQNQFDSIDDESAKMLIFKSGISTSDIITDISGRGLGLAIVYDKIQKLEGTITLFSEKYKGTTFTIILPITISTNRGIIVKVSNQKFVIPTGKVEKVMRIKKDEVQIMESRATILVDNNITPIVKLKDILEIKDKVAEENTNDIISVLVVNDMENKIAFSVDEIIIEQEVIVKRFNKQLKNVRNISGATILGSGEVVPILDIQDLIKSSLKYGHKSVNIIDDIKKHNIETKSIAVIEDSITSRTLLKNILETYGYSVKTAVDGLQGWNMIKSEKFDLVITDVEMPEMNGFELTTKIRSDSEVCDMPVILITSLDSREDKERGIDVGASAYIVKSDFQQSNLFETIKRLI